MAERRTQRDWTDFAVKALEAEAKMAGLLGYEERLVFQPGSVTNGISPEITAYNTTGRVPLQPYWLPRLTYKDTAKIVERLADTQCSVLRSVNQLREFNKAIDATD